MATMDAMNTTEKNTPSDVAERQKSRWMIASTGLNGLLSIAKIGWGVYSGSTVVIADAVHSISDLINFVLNCMHTCITMHVCIQFK
ncbi:Putative Co/Zn/Cd cation efflux protein CzcD (fragment) [Acidithiobacillus ferrivorans]|uniref:Cation diffusion facilitator family transporter n=1 Tax=Acidithiobacillus ferrivorans TaxID=160808 RepID=A0A060UP82_9PROT